MTESIGKRILRLRIEKDMKQKELADKAEITEATLSRYENDLRAPKGEIVSKLASALGVSTDYLLGRTEIKNAEDLKKIKEIESMPDFENAEEALKFILAQPTMMDFGGYDLKNMSEEQIVEIANDMLFAMRLSIDKMKRKNK